MKTSPINQHVTISAIGFGKGGSFPKRMEFGGTTYHFVDAGLCMTVRRRGERIARVFSMSDGQHEFCLRNQSGHWTLVSINA